LAQELAAWCSIIEAGGAVQENLVEIAIFGAGGFAREVEWLIAEKNVHSPTATVCFVGRGDEVGSEIHGIAVVTAAEAYKRFRNAYVICTSGSGAIREAMAQEAASAGFTNYATLIDPGVRFHHDHIAIGAGTVICAGTILTTDIRLGNHVQINLDCTVGHDTEMEDYVTLAPGVHISGRVKICRGAYIGTGASVIPGVTIGAKATIGAGAVVVRDVPAGETHVGIPAKAINRDKAARNSGS
jgi:sugar O-acyltransferase (sialic acid O-acetyltransferase NeuD family)